MILAMLRDQIYGWSVAGGSRKQVESFGGVDAEHDEVQFGTQQ